MQPRSQVAALSCFSVTSCVAAGTLLSATGTEKMLLATWNGRAFTAMKAAAAAGAGSILMLNDVSCPAVKRCVAAGISMNSAGTSGFGFTEMWNGTSWTARKVARQKGRPSHSCSASPASRR